MHFACAWENPEDRQTIAYLAETAEQAGKSVELMGMEEIGFSEEGRFTDSNELPIDKLFNLYPWEWMTQEPFFAEIGQERPLHRTCMEDNALQLRPAADSVGTQSRTPAAAARVSDARRALLARCPALGGKAVLRPRGRRGIRMDRGNPIFTGAADHHGESIAYQKHASLFSAGGRHFVWGLWIIGDECRGLSARGDSSPITGNLSRFYPHRIGS